MKAVLCLASLIGSAAAFAPASFAGELLFMVEEEHCPVMAVLCRGRIGFF